MRYDSMLAAQSIRLGTGKTSKLRVACRKCHHWWEWLKGDLLFRMHDAYLPLQVWTSEEQPTLRNGPQGHIHVHRLITVTPMCCVTVNKFDAYMLQCVQPCDLWTHVVQLKNQSIENKYFVLPLAHWDYGDELFCSSFAWLKQSTKHSCGFYFRQY